MTAATERLDTRNFTLDRRTAVAELIGDTDDFLIVGSVGGPGNDVVAASRNGTNVFPLSGAMGAACPMGLGLALAQRRRRVLVVAGDGELLMSVGSLATIALANPPNLSIVCLDNGRYGETGNQESATWRVADLEAIARGAGFVRTATVQQASEISPARDLLRQTGPVFVLLRVSDSDPSHLDRKNMNPFISRLRFKAGVAAEATHPTT